MSEFSKFAQAVHQRLLSMSKNELFVVGHDNRLLEGVYLQAFPEGTNPMYLKNTEHDCSCCKNFLRNFGCVVSIKDGEISTVWDVPDLPSPYNVVAEKLEAFVRSQPITRVFRSKEGSYGASATKQLLESGQVRTWNHFWGTVEKRHRTEAPETEVGKYASAVQVFGRGLKELRLNALDDVLGLIEAKSLYRGEEHQHAVVHFRRQVVDYLKLGSERRDLFVWENAGPGSRFRNTVIGTLVQDLSEGVPLEQAVASFESKVAPTNYKRTTALITPAMVSSALKTIEDLGLGLALERRHARLEDISVNNVLWADNSAKQYMKSPIENMLMSVAKTKKPMALGASDIGLDAFMLGVLPTAQSMELLVKSTLSSNFMSLTAPVHEGEPKLFKWNNAFAWSYDGNITDSIKEKVKTAGGNVTNAVMRVSLAWFNYDDLDLHVFEPDGNHVYFVNKCGKLDVDMNAGGGRSRTPVENVSWSPMQCPKNGRYKVVVNQYTQRETSDVGFVVEVENQGKITQFSYPKVAKGQHHVLDLVVKDLKIVEMQATSDISTSGLSIDKWGVKTETFVRVKTLLNSPNHWDGQQVGNKHWFFILDGCVNPDPVRGIYNEFLTSDLDVHRKVFEVLGDKAKCPVVEQQLSGLGFSSTKGETVTVKVDDGKSTRVYNVTF